MTTPLESCPKHGEYSLAHCPSCVDAPAMPHVCAHGQLARVCDRCEAEQDVADLKKERDALRDQLRKSEELHRYDLAQVRDIERAVAPDAALLEALLAAHVIERDRIEQQVTDLQARGTADADSIRGLRDVLGLRLGVTETPLLDVLVSIVANVWRAAMKHGSLEDQVERPDGTGRTIDEVNLERMRESLEELRTQGAEPSWRLLLLCEVYEALAETDPARVDAEIVDVATAAIRWLATRRLRATKGGA